MYATWIYTLVLVSICQQSHAHMARIMHAGAHRFHALEHADANPKNQEDSIANGTIVAEESNSTKTDNAEKSLVPAAADGVFPGTKDEINPKPIPSDLPKLPTYKQFCAAVDAYSATRVGGHPAKPPKDLYYQYQDIVARNMSIGEQAMLLANIIWETGGFEYMEEIACRHGDCEYGHYYGRGYIQLTWESNYMDASHAIYGDDRLVRHPELVAKPKDAWKTTMWYWNTNVAPVLRSNNAVPKFKLGYSVMAINGEQECNKEHSNALERLRIYNAILAEWGLAKGPVGKLTGCMKTWDLDAKTPVPATVIHEDHPADAIKQKESAGAEGVPSAFSEPGESAAENVLDAQKHNVAKQELQVENATSTVVVQTSPAPTTTLTNAMEEGLFKIVNNTVLS